MKTRTLAIALTTATLLGSVAFGKPKRRPPTQPPTPSGVSTPPALSNEPEPTAVPPQQPTPPPAPAAPTPAPEPSPPPPKKSALELDQLVNEYTTIRDELFRSRAKAAVLGDALLKTHLVVMFRYEAARAWPLKKVTLKLDERPVYSGESVTNAEYQKIFETVASPGRHVITTRVEASGVGEDRVTYAAEGSVGFDLADDKLTRVDLTVDESGSGPATIARKKAGTFDLRVRADVKSLEIEKK